MRIRIAALSIILLSALATACSNHQDPEAAPNSSLPPLGVPVGPVPGPKGALNLPTNPYENNPVALQEGRRLFVWFNCSGCHGGHAGGGMGPTLRDPAQFKYGNDPAHIFASIAEGRSKGMPSWGTKIPEDQIWKLAAYIKSLGTPQEPDPPKVPPEPEAKPAKKA
jgi:cytochrome c oxidase cbb3-type subunit 3